MKDSSEEPQVKEVWLLNFSRHLDTAWRGKDGRIAVFDSEVEAANKADLANRDCEQYERRYEPQEAALTIKARITK